MSCDKIKPLIGPFRDGELDRVEQRAVASHLEICADCSAALREETNVGRMIADGGRMALPADLGDRIASVLDAEDLNAEDRSLKGGGSNAMLPQLTPRAMGYWGQAAAVVACVISGVGGWYLGSSVERADHMTRDLLQAHVRALVQDNPVQVASSDSHTVRPWFAGKIDIAPNIQDHAGEGFPLIGGRLDYVGDTKMAVVVYKRRLHWINVYLSQAGERPDGGPTAVTRNGYNILNWTKGGIAYSAVSDLEMMELRTLQALL